MKVVQFLDLMEALQRLKDLVNKQSDSQFQMKYKIANYIVNNRTTLEVINKSRQDLIIKYGVETVEETTDQDGNKISVPTGIYNISKLNQKQYQHETALLFKEEVGFAQVGDLFTKDEIEKIQGVDVDLLIALHPVMS